jgi:hypothetical protein
MRPPPYMRSVAYRSVVMRRMTLLDHSTANNDVSIQFLYFTSRNTQCCNNTQQSTQYKFTAQQTRRHLHYVQYTEQSARFIVSPRLPPAVRWAGSTYKKRFFSRVIYYTWDAAGGWEMFLRRVVCSNFCKLHSQAPVQPRCWRDRIARLTEW